MSSITAQNPIHLVQITDTHLYCKPTGTLLKMNTHDSLKQVMDLLRKNEPHIDYIMATGDISQDATPEAYQHFIDSVADLNAPASWIPGNHDKYGVMTDVGGAAGFNEKRVNINNWSIVFLNSSVEGQVHGKLDEEEKAFLTSTIADIEQDSSIDHFLVCLHHNPTKGNSGWMKDIGLQDGEGFFDQLQALGKLRGVVYGHVHQELDYEYRGVRCICTPSTCIQFKPFVTNFALDNLSPGYRSFDLHSDGTIETTVHRVQNFAVEADFGSGGY